MAQKIICPKCSKASYTTAPEVYGPCPYCSFVFNWRTPDRRVFDRRMRIAPLTLVMDGVECKAEFVDISNRGMGVIIQDPPFVKKGDQVRCTFKNSPERTRDTKVVWLKENGNNQRVGLLLL